VVLARRDTLYVAERMIDTHDERFGELLQRLNKHGTGGIARRVDVRIQVTGGRRSVSHDRSKW
jgi:hypothetical protein